MKTFINLMMIVIRDTSQGCCLYYMSRTSQPEIKKMRAIYTYVLVYGLTYGVLLVLDALIFGGGHWGHIAMLLISGELFRLYINMINPGYEDRMAKKYGAPGRKLAERLRRDSQEPR